MDGAWPMAILKDKAFDTYTLKLKTRKTGGPNAFMIPLAIKDNKNYLRVHIGAWWNKVSAFELVANGMEAMVTQPVRLEQIIETNRWYAIEIRVSTATIECYLDGKLLMTYTEPRKIFSIAGRDAKTNEIVVKVVNATDRFNHTKIQIEGTKGLSLGKAIVLSSTLPEDENSFDNPVQFVPKEETFEVTSSVVEYNFKPWSITVLRFQER